MPDRIASAIWEGELFTGKGTVTFDSSHAVDGLPVSWPARAENPDGQTSPEELIAAAHATCFAMSLSNQLKQRGSAPDRLDVSATVTIAKTDAGFGITTSALQVRGSVPGIEADAFAEAAAAAKEGCPVSRALQGNVEITLDAALA
jgi:osmotically inducible protein OsmC